VTKAGRNNDIAACWAKVAANPFAFLARPSVRPALARAKAQPIAAAA